jgi:hypothetical protein
MVPTIGGANLFQKKGPMDQRAIGERPDVLKFSTPVLESPVEVTGRITIELWAESDAPDTDFMAKLVDVYPDGAERLVLDSALRARFLEGAGLLALWSRDDDRAVADFEGSLKAAEAAKKTLFVDETFLYDPLVREMKRVIDAGELGEVFHFSFERLGMGRIRRDSNVWWNSAPHDLSILFYLVPRPVKTVQLYLHTYLQRGVADMAVCHLELEGGVTAHVYLSWLHPEKTATVTVVGRDRMLGYEGRFEKRAITLFDYAIDPSMPPAVSPGAVPIVPITKFEGRKLDIPLGTVDGPIDRAPQVHVFFDSRADWVAVGDELPRLGGRTGLEPLKDG